MMRMVAIALWVCGIMFGATGGALYFGLWKSVTLKALGSNGGHDKIETIKSRPISVPVLSGGQLEGYVIARFAVNVVSQQAKALDYKIEDIVTDEIFRVVYGTVGGDLRMDRKPDLLKISTSIVEQVNARTQPGIVRELLIQEFTFVTKQDARK
jgi:hypothetical protein